MTTEPRLTPAERLILANQYRILALLEPDTNDPDYGQLYEIMMQGYEYDYFRHQPLYDEPMRASESRLVIEILDMCWLLQKGLSQHHDLPEMRFRYLIDQVGFDSKHERPYLIYARFRLQVLKDLPGLKTAPNLETNQRVIPTYRLLLERWHRLTEDSYELTKDVLASILDVPID